MRGKAILTTFDSGKLRITPAYAGKSTQSVRRKAFNRDHPRVCGEKGERTGSCFFALGSPPRMRGKVASMCPFSVFIGITPAYAGKRPICIIMLFLLKDHPRVCGEKVILTNFQHFNKGSPPRMRGKVAPRTIQKFQKGITPAYAGKSETAFVDGRYAQDHPRVCGEKGAFLPLVCVRLGSPPRMRGKVLLVFCTLSAVGITPAYAGKSLAASCADDAIRDHPRVCGEKSDTFHRCLLT